MTQSSHLRLKDLERPGQEGVNNAEQQWRAQLLEPLARRGETGTGAAELDTFLSTVQRRGIRLPPAPAFWPSLESSAGMQRLQLARHVVETFPPAVAQEQLQLMATQAVTLPPSWDDAQPIVAAGLPLVDRDMHPRRHPAATRADLAKAVGWPQTKRCALQVAATAAHRLPYRHYKQLVAQLEKWAAEAQGRLGEGALVALLKIAVLGSTQLGHAGSLTALLEWSDRIDSTVGRAAWLALFQPRWVEAEGRIADVLHAAELTSELSEDIQLHGLWRQLFRGQLSLPAYVERLQDERTQLFARRHPRHDLTAVAEAFAAQPGVPMWPACLQQVLAAAQSLYAQLPGLLTLSATALQSEVGALQATAKATDGQLHGEQRTRLLALACESIRRHLRITPYPTQVMTVLGLLAKDSAARGALAQVKTGEGKSTLVTLLAMYHAALGHRVDVISSSRPLATRDQKKYAPLLSSWGISSAHICRNRVHHAEFFCDVVYGTNTDFEFSLMFEELDMSRPVDRNTPTGRSLRSLDVAIVDEVDNLFIDQGRNSAIISTPQHDPDRWVVVPLLRLAQEWYDAGLACDFLPSDALARARAVLTAAGGDAGARRLQAIGDADLKRWLTSALTAISHTPEQEYVVLPAHQRAALERQLEETGDADMGQGSANRNDGEASVTIVDPHTGQLMLTSRWQDRLHQFVEAKHDLTIRDESLTAAQLSHPVFFGGYGSIFGATGTLGDDVERQELAELYQVTTFDTPPYQPNKRQVNAPILCADEATFLAAITEDIRAVTAAGRPCLVLMETIRESHALAAHLRQADIAYQVLNGLQDEDEELIVARAGREAVVTVATNMAGRGTDIILTPQSRAAGGLHVVMAFYADNIRIEEQGMGRSARQGQPGSARLIIHTETMRPLVEPGDSLDTLADLQNLRERLLRHESRSRAYRAATDREIHRYAQQFYADLRAWETSLTAAAQQGWAERVASQVWQHRGRLQELPSGDLLPGAAAERQTLTTQLAEIARSAVDAAHCRDLCIAWLALFRQNTREELLCAWGETLVVLQRAAQESPASMATDWRVHKFAQQAPQLYERGTAAGLWKKDPKGHFDQQLRGFLEELDLNCDRDATSEGKLGL